MILLKNLLKPCFTTKYLRNIVNEITRRDLPLGFYERKTYFNSLYEHLNIFNAEITIWIILCTEKILFFLVAKDFIVPWMIDYAEDKYQNFNFISLKSIQHPPII